jgi:tryptophan 2,3-dioxygenase
MSVDPNKEVYYSSYLKIDELLSLQEPLSGGGSKPAHDETLFIIIHQTYELWFKQILHEVASIHSMFSAESVAEHQIGLSVARLERVHEIQKILVDQIRVLETMKPLDFLDFRDVLAPASGFQSVQFRKLENILGLGEDLREVYNNQAYHTKLSEGHQQEVIDSGKVTSLLTLIDRWLCRTPFLQVEGFDFWESYKEKVSGRLEGEIKDSDSGFEYLFNEEMYNSRNKRLSYKATQAALFIFLYREQPILHMPYKLLQSLMTMDELFTSWRSRHVQMVHRMLGRKMGTGGSSGYDYLRKTAEKHKVFTDLMDLSTYLIPRSELPELPEELKRTLGFYYGNG